MDLHTLNCKGPLKAGVDQLIYKGSVGSAVTTVTVSGLDGDTDLEYFIKTKMILGASGYTEVWLRPNNDTTDADYGIQRMTGNNSSASSSRDTAYPFIISSFGTLADLSQGEALVFAKSGFIRTMVGRCSATISGTTVTLIMGMSAVWNNTANNMTSMVFQASRTSGIGVGSVIEIFSRRGVRN